MDFKGNLKELRNEKNLTQKELANYLNMSKNVICEWEKGRSEPSIENLKKLSIIFDCSIDFLLGKTDDDFGTSYSLPVMDKETQELLKIFEILNQRQRELLLAYAEGMLEFEKEYKNKK